MTATFFIPVRPDWRAVLMWAFRKSRPGDVIQVANRQQWSEAGNVIHDFPGVTVRLGQVEIERIA